MAILFIEDNSDLIDLIRLTYSKEDIFVAETLAEAKEWLSKKRFSLVFVDLGLPDSNGLNTLVELKEFRVPKVVLTATPNLAREVAKLGAIDYITKTSATEMLHRIGFCITRHHTKQSRLRFEPTVFEQIKSCLCSKELTTA